jgi:hypothetical protein
MHHEGCRVAKAALSCGNLRSSDVRVLMLVDCELEKCDRNWSLEENPNVNNGIIWRLCAGTPWRDVPGKHDSLRAVATTTSWRYTSHSRVGNSRAMETRDRSNSFWPTETGSCSMVCCLNSPDVPSPSTHTK